MTDIAAEFCDVVNESLRRGELDAIDDAALRRVLTAAVKAYAARSEASGGEFARFESRSSDRDRDGGDRMRHDPCRRSQPVRHRHVVPAPSGEALRGRTPMTEIMVGACSDLADGDHRIVAVGELEVGIFRLGDRFVA